MGAKNVNQYHPNWKVSISEVNGHQWAMENDALVSARAVRQPIESKDDIYKLRLDHLPERLRPAQHV